MAQILGPLSQEILVSKQNCVNTSSNKRKEKLKISQLNRLALNQLVTLNFVTVDRFFF